MNGRSQAVCTNLMNLLDAAGAWYVDKRSNGGSFWIVSGQELAETVKKAKALCYTFHFKKEGDRAIKN